jgi:hypothetical protein
LVALAHSSSVPMVSSGLVEIFTLYSSLNIGVHLPQEVQQVRRPRFSAWSSRATMCASSWVRILTLKSPDATPLSSFL